MKKMGKTRTKKFIKLYFKKRFEELIALHPNPNEWLQKVSEEELRFYDDPKKEMSWEIEYNIALHNLFPKSKTIDFAYNNGRKILRWEINKKKYLEYTERICDEYVNKAKKYYGVESYANERDNYVY